MNFNLTDNEWTEIENLIEGKTYLLQSKRGEVNFDKEKILFAQAENPPTSMKTGFFNDCFKFTKSDLNIYIRAIELPVNIHIEEVL